MKTISRYIMTLALLLTAAGGAWAVEPTVYNSTVAVSDLNEGDILIEGAQVTLTSDNSYYLNFLQNRFFLNNATTPSISGFTHNTTTVTVGANGLVTGLSYDATARPATESGEEGNAWEVTAVEDKTVSIVGITYDASALAVSLNADNTEATFAMPAFDATADYELVRDMSVSMPVTVGTGNNGFRIRIKKDEQSGKFVPAEMSPQAMAGLITVTDDIEEKTLTNVTDYTVSIFAIDNNGEPTGDAIAFTDLVPGRYVAKATAATGSAYDGTTALSNIFVLYQGYEVEVPAKEFITYYKDEPLYVEDEAAELYTIQSVNGDQAVLSDKSDAMPSNTPMLVYNKSNETKTFLLIPCAEPDMEITVAPEFQGTLTGTTIAASTENQTNYAFNGKQFVWVKDDITVGANKAWLSVNTGVPSARITLVFDETTKIANTNITNITNGNWYDLNGRKLDKMPTKKGVYIMNGKKVVVK